MKKRILNSLFTVVAATVVITAGGCRAPEYPIKPTQLFNVENLGYSVENRPIELYKAGNGSKTMLIMAGIHGNEQAGIPLTYRLMERIKSQPRFLDGWTMLIIPKANPDGIVKNIRGNANHIDLNRNFPAENRINSYPYGYEALSEPESRILYDLINKYKPIRIVSIHQPLVCIDYDGPAEGLANFMAIYCTLPVNKLGARPGSFGAFTGEERSIPIITLELDRADDLLTVDQLWQKYGVALLASITYPKTPY